MRTTRVIGLTGNVGCGKTAVANMLRRLGAEFVDADVVTHDVLGPGTQITALVAQRFGEQILRPDGAVDRQALARVVFADPKALRDLERIVHPAVLRNIGERVQRSTARAIVIEAIKLIESGIYKQCDQVWVVTCPEEKQIERVVASRHMLREEALQRIRAQSSPAEKMAFADVVIDNGGGLDDTYRQVKEAWQRLTGEP